MWISAKFHIAVVQTFDAVASEYQRLDKQLDRLCRNLDAVTINLSNAGRFLNIGGKKIKPQLQRSIDDTLKQMQPSLELVGGTNSEK